VRGGRQVAHLGIGQLLRGDEVYRAPPFAGGSIRARISMRVA
jgi:hypothetical protein